MDLDIHTIGVGILRDLVMGIFCAKSFQYNLIPYTITRVIPPDITKAKQTETTQRFKVHLITSSGEDLFTKIEFSRRGMRKGVVTQPVSDIVLRSYKLSPLLIPHYNIQSTAMQKICAISSRSVIQARDILDLYILSSQWKDVEPEGFKMIGKDKLIKAYERVFEVKFEQFRDTVLSYLIPEEQGIYNNPSSWDEVKLKTANFIDELRRQYA
jgi:predicted nucleotidyltransferase component of viral defense system